MFTEGTIQGRQGIYQVEDIHCRRRPARKVLTVVDIVGYVTLPGGRRLTVRAHPEDFYASKMRRCEWRAANEDLEVFPRAEVR